MRERDKDELAMLQGLSDLVEFLKRNPEVPVPQTGVSFYTSCENLDDLAAIGRAMGTFEKKIDRISSTFDLTKRFGPVSLCVFTSRSQVCERVVVGVEEVEEKVPVEFETRKVKKEIVEWRCPEGFSILGAGGKQ